MNPEEYHITSPQLDDLLATSEMETPNMKALFLTAYQRGRKDGWDLAKKIALQVIDEKL
jgi:hypothetical protein